MTQTTPTLKLTLGRNDIEALATAYYHATEQLPALMSDEARDFEELILDHAAEMLDLFAFLKERKGQNKFTLNLRTSEVRAMRILWVYPIAQTLYSGEAVRRLCETIDREKTNSTWITPQYKK